MKKEPEFIARSIPGYEGKYWITNHGEIYNNKHKIKPLYSPAGAKVELRKLGQREIYLVSDLMKITFPEVQ